MFESSVSLAVVCRVDLVLSPNRPVRVFAEDRLPRVEIVASYAGVSGALVEKLVEMGTNGIVVAGSGDGSLHDELENALATAVRSGIAGVPRRAYGAAT